MKRYPLLIALLCLITLLALSCAVSPERGAPKTPIVLVSFGVFPTDDLSAFEMLSQKIRAQYPKHTLRWAFTDKTMVEQVRRDKIVLFTEDADGREPYDVVQRLAAEGYRKVLLQPLAMLPSENSHALEAIRYPGMDVVVGKPLIASEGDIDPIIDALASEIESYDTTIVAAPGDADYRPEQRLLVALADEVEAQYPNAFVMSAEGRPGERRLREAEVRARKTEEVHIIPFTFMPRDKAVMHRVFEGQQAWRTLIANPRTTYGQPLVENEAVRERFMERLARGFEATTAMR